MAPSGQCIDIFVATYSCGTTLGAFSDFLIGSLSAATGRKMRFTGTTVLRLQNGNIVEEIGLDETALTQLGLLKAA